MSEAYSDTTKSTIATTNTVTPDSPSRGAGLLGIGLALLLAVASFFSGMQFGDASGEDALKMEAGLFSFFTQTTQPDENVNLDEFWRVWNLMDGKYVAASSSEQVTDEEKLQGAIQGLVRSYGDPYSVFLPPTESEQFNDNISGDFGGVGMEVGIRDGVVTVIAPLPETPAEQAGLLAGDLIINIDGVSTENMTINEAVKRIRGEKGTDVVLGIYREGERELLEIAVTRDTITIPTVETEIRNDVFIISLYSFNAKAEQGVRDALREYVASGSSKLVFDVRGNPGGFLQSAVAIASYFLPSGEVVVREQFSDDASQEELYRSTGKLLRKYTPEEMVVLINGGSASASEIFAGALREHGVATLIGDTTFGKGSVQELVELPEGSSLKVTVARWLTPNGTSISESGLDPDIYVERTVEQVQAGEDPQLDAAVAWLGGDKELAGYVSTSTSVMAKEVSGE